MIALVAGGGPPTAIRLGLAMLALQASIGALNDLLDVDADRVAKPSKPLASGSVSPGLARAVVIGGLITGLGLASVSGPVVAGIALAGVGAGYLYDVRLKDSAWGPVAFAVGVPLLPVFAWFGAAGTLPDPFLALVPAAALGGFALAIANALADEADDRLTGVATAATRLGSATAWRLHVVLLVAMVVVALVALAWIGGHGPGQWLVAAGCALIAVGAIASRPPRARGRPHGWEIEAAGVGLLGAGWLMALGPAAG